MKTWLTIVGIGEDGLAGLAPAARSLVDAAELLVGGERHLSMVPGNIPRRPWPSPFSGAREMLEGLRDRRVVVLASGDPMWFGIGATCARWFPGEAAIIPHPGAFSLAAAALGWPVQDCLCLTVHGRPIEALSLHLAPGRKLLVLSENGATPARIASLLSEKGFGPSRMAVLEHLGGAQQAVHDGRAEDWQATCDDLNMVAIELKPAPGARLLAQVPGLPDDAFEHDGQLTKREIRAVTLSSLAPLAGQTLWDVGAGNGSVAIEWMRAGGQAVAIESHPGRADAIARNALALGVPTLQIIRGLAPEALPYTDPDAVFVGGGVSVPGVMDACWQSLRSGGRLVANAVTAEAEAALLAFHARHGGALTRLAVSRLKPTGGFHTWKPAAPVTQYSGIKP